MQIFKDRAVTTTERQYDSTISKMLVYSYIAIIINTVSLVCGGGGGIQN